MTIRGRGLSLEAAQSVSKDSRSRAAPPETCAGAPSPASTNDDQTAVNCFGEETDVLVAPRVSSIGSLLVIKLVSGSLMG